MPKQTLADMIVLDWDALFGTGTSMIESISISNTFKLNLSQNIYSYEKIFRHFLCYFPWLSTYVSTWENDELSTDRFISHGEPKTTPSNPKKNLCSASHL